MTPSDKEIFFSIVIPTYNRLPILQKCLLALENQKLTDKKVSDYEVIVVDDGSTDDTILWIEENKATLPHVKLFLQNHGGPSIARNLGVEKALGNTIIFIDSDLVVTPVFLQSHADALAAGMKEHGNDCLFTYGRVVNTNNFEHPESEPYKITDFSAAYFATGNVAIPRHWLEKAGPFDTRFTLYGWEDLELGVRLKNLGLKLVKCPEAVGYHWHPPFSYDEMDGLIRKEIERGRMGIVFYKKHPTFDVKLMIQLTYFHLILWNILTLGGLLNEKTMAPFLKNLIAKGKAGLALEFARLFLNLYTVREVFAEYRREKKKGVL